MRQKSFQLSGKWLVTHPALPLSHQHTLEICHDIQCWLKNKNLDRPFKRIHLDVSVPGNGFSLSRDSVTFVLKNRFLSGMAENRDIQIDPYKKDLFPNELKRVLLLYPALLSDRRWNTLQLPTPWLFLGSTLEASRFQVQVTRPSLPLSGIQPEWCSFDVLGFTLYEDLFNRIEPFLVMIRDQHPGLLAAGGPMITLNPLESAYHLTGINLMVRGEAEFVFPELLLAIEKNDLDALMKISGFLFRHNGLLVISDYDRINRPRNFKRLQFRMDFLNPAHLRNGLEANVSRGCSQGCLFCSRLQGKILRQLPPEKLEQLLIRFSDKLRSEKIIDPHARTININDDDLLQDPEYAGEVLRLIKRHRFKLWGIQTSMNSLFPQRKEPDRKLIEMVSDKSLFVNGTPLLWLGTDAFIKKRGKKLGKIIPDRGQMESLLRTFERNGIQNYHYWISSDFGSDWEEFIEEFRFLIELHTAYQTFHILAHAPFLIPYSAAPLYRLLSENGELKKQIRYRAILKTKREAFDFWLVDRVETRYPCLNRLLKNESLVPPSGFFDFLKARDFPGALRTIYSFLKQERLLFDSAGDRPQVSILKKLENIIEFEIQKRT